jgi:hypothetical protein
MREPTERKTPFNTGDVDGEYTMRENHATVLVAMPSTVRRQRIEDAVVARGHDVRVADDGISAVDAIRSVDAVVVGDYPGQISSVVVDATTPPGVARPNVLIASTDGDADAVPDDRLTADATPDAVADAVDSAVERAAYTERVTEFSQIAAEAATSDRGTPALAARVAGLARDARDVQSKFSASDWTAAFRAVAQTAASHSKSGNRTS